MGPQHLQDLVIDACCGRGRAVLSQELCPFGTSESANDHIPHLEADALVVSILSALAGTSRVAEKSTGQEDGDQGWNPGSVPGSLVVL